MRECIPIFMPATATENGMADLSGFHTHNTLRTSHWDSLEKALTIFKLPSNGNQSRVHRRLDLIFAVPEAYWTAVVGW
jgi:hypothetical protein